MEYNTQREQLKINEYGRTISKMIAHCQQLADRNERTRMAHTIVEAMAIVNSKAKERTDYRRTLWDHLMMMADYNLDVDVPYPIVRRESAELQPHHISLPEGKIRFPHYGRALEKMVRTVAEMEPGAERDRLTSLLAHTMKKQYLQWNRDTVDDQTIVDQLAELSDGRLSLPEGYKLPDTQYFLDTMALHQEQVAGQKKKKKKKKKKFDQ